MRITDFNSSRVVQVIAFCWGCRLWLEYKSNFWGYASQKDKGTSPWGICTLANYAHTPTQRSHKLWPNTVPQSDLEKSMETKNPTHTPKRKAASEITKVSSKHTPDGSLRITRDVAAPHLINLKIFTNLSVWFKPVVLFFLLFWVCFFVIVVAFCLSLFWVL